MRASKLISFDEIKIEQRPYQLIIDFLSEVTRINFNYYRRNFIERRLKARMIRVGSNTLDCYYKYLLSNKGEIKKFVDSFTINYSYFFRNWEVFDLFQTLFLKSLEIDENSKSFDLTPNPYYYNKIKKISKIKNINQKANNKELVQKLNRNCKPRDSKENKKTNKLKENQLSKRIYKENSLSYLKLTSLYQTVKNWNNFSKPITIWSCACAAGEEPYSLAMILDNLKSKCLKFQQYKIIASDIDQRAIDDAKKGMYYAESIKEISPYFEQKYFSKKEISLGLSYSIKNEIKNQVEFHREDITNSHNSLTKFDIIFCRYLLIYFDRENRNKFIKIIENRLNYGGLLFLGKTETLFNSESKMKLVDSREHVYLKV
jgi:chemotaxis methyl-accepting protein methylase